MYVPCIVTNYCLLLQDWDEAYKRNLDEFEGRTHQSDWDRYWRIRYNMYTDPHLTVVCYVTGTISCGTPVGLRQSGTSWTLITVSKTKARVEACSTRHSSRGVIGVTHWSVGTLTLIVTVTVTITLMERNCWYPVLCK